MTKKFCFNLRQSLSTVLVSATALLITGCSTVSTIKTSNDYLSGRYERYISAHQDDEKLKPQQQAMLCRSYFELRNYRAFSECAAPWLTPSQNQPMPGDTNTAVWIYDHFSMPVHSMQAAFALDFNELEKAEQSAEIAISQWLPQQEWPLSYHWSGELPDAVLRAYKVQGLVALRRGERDKFEEVLQTITALNIDDSATGEGLIRRNFTLATLHVADKNYHKAQEIMSTYDGRDPVFRLFNVLSFNALDELKNSLLDSIAQNPYKIFMRAKLAFETGSHEEAEKLYKVFISLDEEKQLGLSALRSSALHDLARIQRARGALSEAQQLLEKSIALIESQRATLTSEASKIGFVSDKEAIYGELMELLLIQKDIAKAYETVERAKARSLVDILANKDNFPVKPSMDADFYRSLVQQMQRERETVEKGLNTSLLMGGSRFSSQIPEMIDQGQAAGLVVKARFLDGQQEEAGDLREDGAGSTKDKNANQEMASLLSVDTLPLNEVLPLIPEGHGIIEYFGYGDKLHVFYLDAQGLLHHTLDASGLQLKIAQFRKSVLTPEDNSYQGFSQQLYAQLFEPIRSTLRTKRLIVVPHGPINYLPFNALHDGQAFLIDQYKFSTLSSVNVMRYLGDNNGGKKIFLLGNPDLNRPELDLYGAEEEIQSIAGRYPQALKVSRKQATESLVKEVGVFSDLIHIASHGEFVPESPLASRLLLAKDVANDGNLTVDDVYDLSITADLVVLSACETGLGKIMNGADVIGLNRAFLYAGSDTVISSLWVVDDLATKELMVKFYEYQGMLSKSESLRQAQIYVKEHISAHPFYWSAFQFSGEV